MIILNSHIKAADLHAQRLSIAFKNLHPILPLTPELLEAISENNLGHLDMLSTRFSKLQDLIGSKIFPIVLKKIQESALKDSLSFIDILNFLEKYKFLPEVQMWVTLRETRNMVTHEYPDDPRATFENLAQIIEQANVLLNYWGFLKNEIEQRIIKGDQS